MLSCWAFLVLGSVLQPCVEPRDLPPRDPDLQRALEEALYNAGFSRHLEQEKLAVSLVDLNPRGRRYADVNGDVMLYAASLPKIGILLSVFDLGLRGEVPWDWTHMHRLERMITVSSNSNASWGFNVVGAKGIASVIQDPRYCLYHPEEGGLWVGRGFGGTTGTIRDPLFNISHGATSRQTARFYLLLYDQKLVSPYASERMLSVMGPPGHHHKFVAALGHHPGMEFLARKSGTWRNFHADSALIRYYGSTFILVGLAELSEGEYVLRRVADEVHGILHKK